jgi:hypothetical protein
LLGIHVRNELIGEEELDANSDCGIDDQFGGVVLSGATGNAIDYGILSSEGID